MIGFLFSPFGRYLLLAVAILMVVGGIYGKVRANAVAGVQAAAQADALKRVQNAITSGDNAVVSPDRLFESDGHRRD